jgi:hypothetical protein
MDGGHQLGRYLSFLDSGFSSNSYMFQLTCGHLQAVHLLQYNSFILYQHIYLFLEIGIPIFK